MSEFRGHWHQPIAGLSIVPSEFYDAVTQAVERRQIPGARITKTSYSEGGIGSALRVYLRVERGDYKFDICGAPFADGSFISWWLIEEPGCLQGCLSIIPFVGAILVALFYRETYYKVDTRLMFQSAIHAAVLEVLDQMTAAKGIRALSETERIPTIPSLLK